jgi:hypothetical protein
MPSRGTTAEPERRQQRVKTSDLDTLSLLCNPWLDRDTEAVEYLADLDRAGASGAQLVRR